MMPGNMSCKGMMLGRRQMKPRWGELQPPISRPALHPRAARSPGNWQRQNALTGATPGHGLALPLPGEVLERRAADVAIVGDGPAALAAAYTLSKRGKRVRDLATGAGGRQGTQVGQRLC
jgi:hypothetical protein